MSVLPAPQFPPVVGESGAQRIVRIIRSFNNCSLSSRREELAALVGRGIDDESVVEWQTNCCTSALAILFAAGCGYSGLALPLKNGLEFELLEALGDYYSAWRTLAKDGPPKPGALCWYEIGGTNDDHVEWELDNGDHGGGGRADNEITVEHGPVAQSLGRPMKAWLDPDAIGLPDAVAQDGGDPVA